MYIPKEKNQDIMFSNKIGFIIEINSKSYRIETEQDEEIASIMKNHKVEIITQIIDNHKFVDIRKIGGEKNE